MNEEDMTHDILKGVLNGVVFDTDFGDDPLEIPAVPCEVCGRPIWLGIIVSTCGDTNRAVHEEWPEGFGFQDHACKGEKTPDCRECPVCFKDDDEDEDEDEFLPVSTPVVRFLEAPPAWEWTAVPVAR